MAITIPSGFNITVNQPVDTRIILTKAQMVEIVDAKLPQVYFCICKDDGALYLYNVNNTALSTTGKFRKFEGGAPDAYLKSASVSNNTLTLTKQDDSTVVFTPTGGATYTAGANIQISDENVISATDTTYTAGAGININNNVIAIDSNSGIAIYDNRVSDANQWLTNGYTKTSAEIPTINLPPVCTENDRWGVLLYVAENNENKAGLQQYFPIDGAYKGRVFYRSVTGYSTGIDPDFGDWELVPWYSEKQDVLTVGTNISIDNNVISAIDTKIATSITLGKEITATQTVGGIVQGTVYSSDTTLAKIIEDLIGGTGPTPGTEVTLYYGASSTVPTGLSGLTSTTVQSSALVGDHAYTIVCEDDENGQYPVFAVPVGNTLSKWVTIAASAFQLEFNSITAENYNIYYLVNTVYDAPDGTNYTFTIA